jgi:hypothetical protein
MTLLWCTNSDASAKVTGVGLSVLADAANRSSMRHRNDRAMMSSRVPRASDSKPPQRGISRKKRLYRVRAAR